MSTEGILPASLATASLATASLATAPTLAPATATASRKRPGMALESIAKLLKNNDANDEANTAAAITAANEAATATANTATAGADADATDDDSAYDSDEYSDEYSDDDSSEFIYDDASDALSLPRQLDEYKRAQKIENAASVWNNGNQAMPTYNGESDYDDDDYDD
jgi:hypothetical protein